MILEIYEIQNIGKGIITTIIPDNLLLITDSTQGVQTWEDTLNEGANLTNTHYVDISDNHRFTMENETGGFFELAGTNLEPFIPNATIGRGVGNLSTDNSLKFYSDRTIFNDGVNSRGIEYGGDYEINFLPRTLVTLQKAQSLISTIPPYTSGTGISIASNVITNTAPDQIVSITGGGATSVTGTYPNFTVTTPTSSAGLQVVTITLGAWSLNWGTVVFTGLAPDKILLNVSIFAECKIANNNYSVGDITSISTIDINDSGGLADGGAGVKFKPNVPDHIWVGINDRIAVNEAVIAASTAIGNPFVITETNWSLRFVILYQ